MRIIFKDKRNSSGTIKDGEILLYISSRLPKAEQQRHIHLLTERLTPKLERARAESLAAVQGGDPSGLPAGLSASPVRTDKELAAWAAAINDRFYQFPRMGEVRFRRQESRWGSCSGRTRNIQIAERLRGGPHELLEYVLVHEVAHLGELNHSSRFWALVERGCPDYRQRRELLRQYELFLRSMPPGYRPFSP